MTSAETSAASSTARAALRQASHASPAAAEIRTRNRLPASSGAAACMAGYSAASEERTWRAASRRGSRCEGASNSRARQRADDAEPDAEATADTSGSETAASAASRASASPSAGCCSMRDTSRERQGCTSCWREAAVEGEEEEVASPGPGSRHLSSARAAERSAALQPPRCESMPAIRAYSSGPVEAASPSRGAGGAAAEPPEAGPFFLAEGGGAAAA